MTKKTYNERFLEVTPNEKMKELIDILVDIRNKDKLIFVFSKEKENIIINYFLVDNFTPKEIVDSVTGALTELNDRMKKDKLIDGEEH